jgi:Replicase family
VPLDAIAPWHALTSHIVGMAAHRAAPHLDDLANFLLPHMPKRVLASNNIRSEGVDERYSYRAMLEYAVTQPWISFDSPHWQNAIVVDVDDPDGAARIEQLATQYGVPRPVLVVDPWSGYSHAMWRLAAPVHEGAHKANRILAYASHMLAAALASRQRWGAIARCSTARAGGPTTTRRATKRRSGPRPNNSTASWAGG